MAGFHARAGQFLLGLLISSIAYGLTVRAALGLGPLFLIQQGLEQHLDLSPGGAATILGLTVAALGAALRGGVGIGTVLGPILGGLMIDATLPSLPSFSGFVLRVVVCSLATVVMMLGAVMITRARLGANGLDGVMRGLARLSGRSAGLVRLGMEAAMLVVGLVLGSPVGLGTVLTAMLVGHSYQFWMRVLGEAPHVAQEKRSATWILPARGHERWRLISSPNRPSSTGSSRG